MMAAASDHADPAMVRMLLDRGARVDARDDEGRSALDWALMQGETDVARLLRQAGAPVSPARLDGHDARRRAGPAAHGSRAEGRVDARHDRTVVQQPDWMRLVPQPEPAGDGATRRQHARHHHRAGRCLACDCGNASAVEAAPECEFRRRLRWSGLCADRDLRPDCHGRRRRCRRMASPTVRRYASPRVRVRTARGRSTTCGPRSAAIRFSTRHSPFVRSTPTRRRRSVVDTQRRIDAARAFLLQAEPRDTQDEAMKLIGLVWAKAPSTAIAAQARRLKTLQRANGGWGQTPLMSPDAYATGQSLFALRALRDITALGDLPARRAVSADDAARRRIVVRAVARIRVSAVSRVRIPARPEPVHLCRGDLVGGDGARSRDRGSGGV